jgi:hypothetical protein
VRALKGDAFGKAQRVFVLAARFAGVADDQVGGDGDIGHGGAQSRHALLKKGVS